MFGNIITGQITRRFTFWRDFTMGDKDTDYAEMTNEEYATFGVKNCEVRRFDFE